MSIASLGTLSGTVSLQHSDRHAEVTLGGNLIVDVPTVTDGDVWILKVTQPVDGTFTVTFAGAGSTMFGGSPITLDSNTSRYFGMVGWDGIVLRLDHG